MHSLISDGSLWTDKTKTLLPKVLESKQGVGDAQALPFLLVFFLPVQSVFLIIFTPTSEVTSQAEHVQREDP